MNNAPIIGFIRKAMAAHHEKYGMAAEKLYASPMMEGALVRWADANMHYPADLKQRLQGAEVFGMPIFRMTRKSALVEFYLTSERDKQLYTSHAVLEPETVGIRKAVNTNGITLESNFTEADE